MPISQVDATYKRWKYMMGNDIPVPIGLDARILDRMQGNDNGPKYPLSEMIAPHIQEEVICSNCENPTGGMINSMQWKYFIDHIAPGICWIPPYCDDCEEVFNAQI